jgi:hypothetical protein
VGHRDAIRYFGAVDGEGSPKVAVENRIEKLQKGYASSTGWTLVLDDFFDQQDLCKHDIFNFSNEM